MEIRKPKTLIWIKDLLLTDIVNLLKEKADAIEAERASVDERAKAEDPLGKAEGKA